MSEKPGIIFKQIAKVMADVNPVGKGGKNEKQGYKYRSVDDCYNELNPIMARHGIFTVSEILGHESEERKSSTGNALFFRILKIRFTFYAEDGSFVQTTTIGEGMDSGDKASNKAMAVAHKYALTQTFIVPTADQKDPETDSHEVKPQATKPAAAAPTAKPAAANTQPNTDEIYEERNDQKSRFANIAVKVGVDKHDDITLREISGACKGTGFLKLEQKIKDYLQNPIGARQ